MEGERVQDWWTIPLQRKEEEEEEEEEQEEQEVLIAAVTGHSWEKI